MSDLRPIGPAVIALTAELATPDALQAEHVRTLGTFKKDHDAEGAMLRFAHLAAVAIQSLRCVGESHAEHSPGCRTRDLGPRPGVAVVRGPGGGWFAAPEQAATPGTEPAVSLRPH